MNILALIGLYKFSNFKLPLLYQFVLTINYAFNDNYCFGCKFLWWNYNWITFKCRVIIHWLSDIITIYCFSFTYILSQHNYTSWFVYSLQKVSFLNLICFGLFNEEFSEKVGSWQSCGTCSVNTLSPLKIYMWKS